MREVYNRSGALVGTIDDAGGVADTLGRRVGTLNPLTRQVRDGAGKIVGQVHDDGSLFGLRGELLGTVAARGDEVRDGFGARVGRVTRDETVPAARDMQQRGAGALLLLCRPVPPAGNLRGLAGQLRDGQVPAWAVERMVLWALVALFAVVWLFGTQLVALLHGGGDPVAVLAGLAVAAIFVLLFVREVRSAMK